jgi:hypothetical protein
MTNTQISARLMRLFDNCVIKDGIRSGYIMGSKTTNPRSQLTTGDLYLYSDRLLFYYKFVGFHPKFLFYQNVVHSVSQVFRIK